MKAIKIFVFLIISISYGITVSYALTNEQHLKLLDREDYKLSYQFLEEELNSIKNLLPADKFKVLSSEIFNGIDLEVKYIKESHPFYDVPRMYAVVLASKALQLKWLADFLKENKTYSQDQFKKFLHDINITNVYNFIAKTMETPDDFSVTNDLPIQCNYEKDFSNWNKNLGTASRWLYSITPYDPTIFSSFLAGVVLHAASLVDRQEFRCHFRANVTKAKIYYFYKGLASNFYQVESEEIGKKQFANGIQFNSHTVKSNLVGLGIETTQKIKGKKVEKFTVYQIDRDNQDLILCDTKHFVEQVMPLFKPD